MSKGNNWSPRHIYGQKSHVMDDVDGIYHSRGGLDVCFSASKAHNTAAKFWEVLGLLGIRNGREK